MMPSPLPTPWMMMPSQDWYTPLMLASQMGYVDVVRALVACKADVNAKGRVGVGGNGS